MPLNATALQPSTPTAATPTLQGVMTALRAGAGAPQHLPAAPAPAHQAIDIPRRMSARQLIQLLAMTGQLGNHQGPAPTSLPPECGTPADLSKERMIWVAAGDQILSHLGVLARQCHKRSQIIVLLHEEALRHADSQQLRRIEDDERFAFIYATEPREQAQTIGRTLNLDQFDAWKPILTRIDSPKDLAHYKALFDQLTGVLNTRAVGHMTRLASSHLFMCNALINAPLASDINRLSDLAGCYANRPALIVATGPSLNKQLETLKRYRNYFVVVAVDPAVPILKAEGITPDFVFTIDPRKRPYWNQDALADDTTFCIDVGCCPDSAWSSTKRYLVAAAHRDVAMLLSEWGAITSRVGTGGSVSTNAFNFALELGCNPVVMIGQDLAWTEGKDHAEGYTSQYTRDVLERRHAGGFDIAGYGGQTVRTEKQLLYYKNWFEDRIRQLEDKIIINATEGGALIEGASHLPFATVCKELASFGPVITRPELTRPWSPDPVYLARYRQGIDEVIEAVAQLQVRLESSLLLIRDMKKTPKKTTIAYIKETNDQIQKLKPTAKVILDMFCQLALAGSEKKISKLEEERKMKSMYEAYGEVYKSALAGMRLVEKVLPSISAMVGDLLDGHAPGRELLVRHGLNRWTLDGQKNTAIDY